MRIGTESDIGWIVDRCRVTHGYAGLGVFDPDKVADSARQTQNLIIGDSVLCRADIELETTGAPTVNHVCMWHTTGAAWALLDAHEAASNLPASVGVMHGHPRSVALLKALERRGYRAMETTMVKL